jgi:transposase-like protein
MNMHKNARLTPLGRERIVRQVESGQTPEAVSETAGVCPRTVRKWVERYRRDGLAGLQDRSSGPHRLRRPTPQTVTRRSNGYAASAGRVSRSPLRPVYRQRLSAVFCVG